MGGVPASGSARRGLLVIIDGLAIALLAVLLTPYTIGSVPSRTPDAVAAAALELVRTWIVTPGVTIPEALVLLGLTIAGIGFAWYVLLRPLIRRIGIRSLVLPMPKRFESVSDGGFRFDHHDRASERDTPDRVSTRSTRIRDEPSLERERPDWLDDVIEDVGLPRTSPTADFHRSATVDANGGRPKNRAVRPADGTEDGFQFGEAPDDGTDGDGTTPPEPAQEPSMVDKTEDVDIADSPPEPVAEPPRDAPITVYATLDEETPSATPVSQPADGGGDPDDSPQSGKRPSGRRHEPMDEAPVGRTPLLERLAREVEGSRQRIRRVGDRLSSANDTSSPESAVQSIHREIEATSTKVERLNRDLEANGSPTAIAVDVILEEQQRIVTGFEDLLGNED